MSDCDCEIENVEEVIIEEPAEVKVEKPKAKRAPSAYNMFVKENMSKLKDVPVKERMKKLGVMWKEQKAKAEKKAKKATKTKKPKKAKK